MATPQSTVTLLPFADLKGCKKWLIAVPVQNPMTAQQAVLETMVAFNQTAMDAMERLKCLEVLRERVHFLYVEIRSKLILKSMPLTGMDHNHWRAMLALHTEMENGYRLCLNVAEVDGGEVSRAIPFMLQRIIRYLTVEMHCYNLTYRRVPDALWGRLNNTYREAEGKNVHREFVKDSLEAFEGGSSIQLAYIETVLRQSAELTGVAPAHLEVLESIVKQSSTKAGLVNDSEGQRLPPSLAVELSSNKGALPAATLFAGETTRFLATDLLFRYLRGQRKKLEEGATPGSLQFPDGWTKEDAIQLIQRLERLWCGPGLPKPLARVPNETQVQLCTGFFEAYLFVAQKSFEPPEGSRRLSSSEERDIAMFGQISESTHQKMRATPNVTLDTWGIIDESAGVLRLMRPTTASRSVGIGRLVALKVGLSQDFYLAAIREMVHEDNDLFSVAIQTLPGKPFGFAITVPERNKANSGEEWFPCFQLPAFPALNQPATLILPIGLADAKRNLRGFAKLDFFDLTVTEVIERGTDFARVAFAIAE